MEIESGATVMPELKTLVWQLRRENMFLKVWLVLSLAFCFARLCIPRDTRLEASELCIKSKSGDTVMWLGTDANGKASLTALDTSHGKSRKVFSLGVSDSFVSYYMDVTPYAVELFDSNEKASLLLGVSGFGDPAILLKNRSDNSEISIINSQIVKSINFRMEAPETGCKIYFEDGCHLKIQSGTSVWPSVGQKRRPLTKRK